MTSKLIISDALRNLLNNNLQEYKREININKAPYTRYYKHLKLDSVLSNPYRDIKDFCTKDQKSVDIDESPYQWLVEYIEKFGDKEPSEYFSKAYSEYKNSLPTKPNILPENIKNEKDIKDIYSHTDNSIIFIYSADGFLETQDRFNWLFLLMCSITTRNNLIYYVYEKNSLSSHDWKILRKKFDEEENIDQRKIKGFSLDCNYQSNIFNNLRIIAIDQKNTGLKEEIDIYYYVRLYSRKEIGEQNHFWLKPTKLQSINTLRSITDKIIPIQDINIYETDFPDDRQKHDYSRSFHAGDCEYDDRYVNIIGKTKWCPNTEDLLDSIFRYKHVAKQGVLNVLDVGCGDCRVSKIIWEKYNQINKENLVTMKVIDPDNFFSSQNSLFDCEQINFEDMENDNSKFDTIIFFHSLYLINPSRIKQAYSMLKDDGEIVIVTSPLEGNYINQITNVVDKYSKIGQAKYVNSQEVYRNYAELTKEYLNDIFMNVKISSLNYNNLKTSNELFKIIEINGVGGKIQYSDVINEKEKKLTSFGWETATFFSHGKFTVNNSKVREEIEPQIMNSLKKDKNGFLNADMSIYIIKRKSVDRHMREKTFFSII